MTTNGYLMLLILTLSLVGLGIGFADSLFAQVCLLLLLFPLFTVTYFHFEHQVLSCSCAAFGD